MPTPREAARIRKQAQRTRQREAARLSAEAGARQIEQNEERLAPAIMRNAITSPDGHILVGPRVHIVNGRATRTDPVQHSKSPLITAEHKRAARQLQLDWNEVGAGVGVGAVDYLRSGGGGDGTGGHVAMMGQVGARLRLEAAITHLGAFAPSIARVVLDCIPICAWVCEPDPFGTIRTIPEGIAWLASGLSRLAAFYDPPVQSDRVGIRSIGPARSVYSVAA